MSDIAIKIENLGKRYRYGGVAPLGQNLRADLAEWARSWFRASNGKRASFKEIHERNLDESPEYFWALRDVTVDIRRGEVVGIIGRNGAGKSTMLKLLSRITQPTTGTITYEGRVASLLEVGAGFHRELTGRENVFLNGSILGMRRSEIAKKFDEIVAFAGVDKFIDTPVKFYSSGMYVRLAFAVAAHLEPDIMLVDEVLAVGDAAFQKKCLGKMENVAKQGRTVLFVSHNLGAIRSLTQKCLYLKSGRMEAWGGTEEVTRKYFSDVLDFEGVQRPSLEAFHRDSIRHTPVKFQRIWVNDAQQEIPQLEMGQPFTVHAELSSAIEIRGGEWSIALKKRDGNRVMTILSSDYDARLFLPRGTHLVSCTVKNLPLTPGEYLVDIGINQSDGNRAWDLVLDYPIFRIGELTRQIKHWTNRPWGAVHWAHVEWSSPCPTQTGALSDARSTPPCLTPSQESAS
jgi:lipopolysaccharide transport system ATP-binding protein